MRLLPFPSPAITPLCCSSSLKCDSRSGTFFALRSAADRSVSENLVRSSYPLETAGTSAGLGLLLYADRRSGNVCTGNRFVPCKSCAGTFPACGKGIALTLFRNRKRTKLFPRDASLNSLVRSRRKGFIQVLSIRNMLRIRLGRRA